MRLRKLFVILGVVAMLAAACSNKGTELGNPPDTDIVAPTKTANVGGLEIPCEGELRQGSNNDATCDGDVSWTALAGSVSCGDKTPAFCAMAELVRMNPSLLHAQMNGGSLGAVWIYVGASVVGHRSVLYLNSATQVTVALEIDGAAEVAVTPTGEEQATGTTVKNQTEGDATPFGDKSLEEMREQVMEMTQHIKLVLGASDGEGDSAEGEGEDSAAEDDPCHSLNPMCL